MAKKHRFDEDHEGDEPEGAAPETWPVATAPPPARGRIPAFSVGDVLAVLILSVLSAALLLEGYYSGFKDYSKEIIALFAIVAGFILGRKT